MSRCERWRGVMSLGRALVVGVFLAGCATAPATTALPIPPREITEYEIRSGDQLAVQFYYHPSHNQPSVLVGNDGRIMLPLVGEVLAAGLTPSQLSAQLEALYSTNLRDPRIAVAITTVNESLVWVGGEVQKPGFVAYVPGLTAIQALQRAGGLRDTAAPENSLLLQRVGRNEYRSAHLDLAKPLTEGDTKSDWVLGPRDVIFVPKSGIAKANVWVDQYITRMIPIRFHEDIADHTR